MSRWFRHYAGLCRDEKLVSVAIKSRQPIERVVWVWAAILESAAEIDDNGRYILDTAEVAYFLRADEADILSVVSALGASGRLDADTVVKWSNRQFRSDRSAERVAAHRERKRQTDDRTDGNSQLQNTPVTLQKRQCNSPELETELDTTPDTNVSGVVRAKARPEHAQILEILTSVIPEAQAKAVMDHRRKKKSPLNPHSAGLLVKQFQQLAEPEKGADLMMTRGWTGCDPEWCANAGLKLASSPSPVSGPGSSRTFVKRDSDAWWAWRDYRKAQGKPMPTAVTSKEHAADGWWFDAEFPPVQAYSGRGRDAA